MTATGREEPPGDVAAARDALGVCAPGEPVYMNIGGAGPLPAAAVDAIIARVWRSAGEGRGSLAAVMRMEGEADRLRRAASELVGGAAGEVALTGNTTGGINIVLWGVDWSPGDEIITTTLEHPGVSVPVGVLARRHGLRVRHLPAEEARGDLAGAVARRAGPRTRIVVLSHVAYGTGEILDVAGAARAARRAGALCVVDGAQSVGAIPVDAPALGADAYAFPAHKWLYGPEGLGALWVAGEAGERIAPSFSGYETGTGHAPDGGVDPHPGARRFEMSTPPMPLLAGFQAAIDWLAAVGWRRVHARIAEGRARAADALGAIPGVTVLTPPEAAAGLVTFAVAGADPARAAAAMVRDGVIVRWLEHPPALRASIGFHWCNSDIERLAAAVRGVAGC